ncbi:MAG: heme exporter protein CcmB [Flavobacteriales bacterium]
MIQRIYILLRKDLRLEFRSKTGLSSLLMYALGSVFIIYMSVGEPEQSLTWNALFWITLLYSCVNSVMRAFYYETSSMRLYYYQVAHPQEIIFAKLLYSYALNTLLLLVSFGAFTLVLGNLVQNMPLFVLVSLLSTWGIGAMLTLISAISAQTNNAAGILPVLAFPVLLPLFLSAIKATSAAIDGEAFAQQWENIAVLGLFNILAWLFSYLLFPYLWRS